MTRKSPEEKRLRLQGLTVFPKGTTRWEKNAYHFRVALVPIKGDFLANELGWLVLVNDLLPRLSSFLVLRPMMKANIMRSLYLCGP